ncbi:hypothetical protein [Agaribacterium haliotis]|uniref:hypothetical protein n=1 Tax=Agaribacterium haliotis TaxID=2013869 RepID=UPI000BB532A6|nr:hypothetical protein [Agaribacterium haliotis]
MARFCLICVKELNSLEISIPATYFAKPLSQVHLHAPGGHSQTLNLVLNERGDYSVVVDRLGVWALLELVHE